MVPEPMLIGPEMTPIPVPVPPNKRLVFVPETPPDKVKMPASELMRVPVAPSVMAPAKVLVPAILRRAPPKVMPVP